jgi:steroid delta-isomerase-like uncharacterized protein
MDNAALVRTWFEELWNRGREDVIDRMLSEKVVIHGLGSGIVSGEPIKGREEFRRFYRGFRTAFPDLKIRVEDTVTEGDRVAARCRVTGNHTGDGLGLTATGRSVDFGGMCIVRLVGGHFAEAWNEFDFLQCYQQLGVVNVNFVSPLTQGNA